GAVSRATSIEKRDPIVDEGPACRQGLAGGADIGVRGFVVAEVLAREGPVFSLGLVDDRDMRRDPLLRDQPVQHRRRSIGGISGEPVRLDRKSTRLYYSHGPRRATLGLANGPRGL